MTRIWEKDIHAIEGPADSLAAEITAAAASDKLAEAQVKKRATAAVILLLLCVVFFFMAAGRKGKFKKRDKPYQVMSFILGACGVASAVAARRAWRRDVDEDKLAAALGLLKVIAVDTPKGASARLSLDLRPYEHLKPTSASSGSKTFVQGWLALEGELADGNKYRLSVVEKVRRKEKSKRKWTKVRENSRTTLRLSLRLRPDYGSSEDLAQRLQALRPPEPLSVRTITPQGRVLTAVLALPPVQRRNSRYQPLTGDKPRAGADPMLKAFLWAYAGLGRKA